MEAARLANQFFAICVRTLDYCPPVDITFGSFLRSLVTADIDVHPDDSEGLRDAILQAFRLRGILPEEALSFGEGAVAWPRPKPREYPPIRGLDFGDPNGLVNVAPQWREDGVGRVLRAYVKANAQALGFLPQSKAEILVPSFHPVFRINPDGSLRTDMVVQAVQTIAAGFDDKTDEYGMFPVRGGVSLIVTKPVVGEEAALTDEAEVRYAIKRRLSPDRTDRQRRFGERLGLAGVRDPNPFRLNFALVHGGA
jgi:hypothetical protein